MRLFLYFLVLSAVFPSLSGCQLQQHPSTYTTFANYTGPSEFAAYWYQNQAEVSSYDLGIEQFGEFRRGEAVLIFSAKDISKSEQVELTNPDLAGDDRVPVMKLNKYWRFNTGLSDCSLMGTVFTPIDLNLYPFTLKQTTTVQDWSGQDFLQLSRQEDGYDVKHLSYYQSGEDQDYSINPDLLEDEIFTRIRINPASVPSGEIEIVPGDFFRLAREPVKPKRARVQFLKSEATTQCLVEYLHLNRTVRINFETAFPHKILSWTEEQDQRVVVEGKLRKTVLDAYWEKNSGSCLPMRDSLDLMN